MASLKDPVVGTRLPRDLIAQLDVIAAEWQVTRADVLRRAVGDLIETHTAGHATTEPERSSVT